MLRAGIYPKIVSERLGHSSIKITLDTYSHVLPGLQEAAAQRFDDFPTDRGQKGAVSEIKNDAVGGRCFSASLKLKSGRGGRI